MPPRRRSARSPVPSPRDRSSGEVTARLLRELRALDGLRPWCPVRTGNVEPPWDSGVLAVDIAEDAVRIKLVATRLPLPPRLDQAEAAARRALRGSRWATVPLRLIVAGLDATALGP